MKKLSGINQVVIIAAVVVLIVIGVFMAVNKSANLNTNNKKSQPTEAQQSTPSTIQTTGDLDTTAVDLDKVDIDGIDRELEKIDADSSTF